MFYVIYTRRFFLLTSGHNEGGGGGGGGGGGCGCGDEDEDDDDNNDDDENYDCNVTYIYCCIFTESDKTAVIS